MFSRRDVFSASLAIPRTATLYIFPDGGKSLVRHFFYRFMR